MKQFLILLLLESVLGISVYAQRISKEQISYNDKELLTVFENKFKTSINKRDKISLSKLLKFPFYCSACLDYTKATDSMGNTVAVTKKIFNK